MTGAGQDWEDILSEPISSVRDEGWRVVRGIEEVSPRPQTPPAALSALSRWLILKLPHQEDDSPLNARRLPASLADQLSLTLAARRRRSRGRTEEDGTGDGAHADGTDLAGFAAGDDVAVNSISEEGSRGPSQPPLWQRPLRLLARLLPGNSNSGVAGDPGPDQGQERPPAPRRSTGAMAAPPAPPEPADGDPPEVPEAAEPPEGQTSLGGETSLPIVLARRAGRLPAAATFGEERGVPNVTHSAGESMGASFGGQGGVSGQSVAAEPPQPIWRKVMGSLAPRPLSGAAPSAGSSPPDEAPAPRESGQSSPTSAEPPGLVHHLTAASTESTPGDWRGAGVAARTNTAAPATPASESQPRDASEDSAGEPLSPVLRERMERLLDVPLSEVRIFRGSSARRITRRFAADAVSVAGNVYLDPPRGGPETPSGRALLAHELGHVAARRRPDQASLLEEEAEALRLEHAVRRQDLAGLAPDFSTNRAGRSHPLPGVTSPWPSASEAAGADLVGLALGGKGVRPPQRMAALQAPPVFASEPGGGQIARAGRERPAALAEPAAASEEEPAAQAGQQDAAREQAEGLVEKAVEAVMRRLRRENDLERERRGVFRSEIGG